MAPAPDFFQAAPAPDFFPSGSGTWYFFRAAPAPRGQKHPAPAPRGQKHPAPVFGEIFVSPQTGKVKLQKKYKTSKIIVFFNHKTAPSPGFFFQAVPAPAPQPCRKLVR